MNQELTAMLTKKAAEKKGEKDYRVVMVKVPNDVYAKIMKDQSKLLCQAADDGDTSNITMHTVIIKALRELEV